MLRPALFALVTLVAGHPSSLECGTDASTRLKVGSTIMGSTSVAATSTDVKLDVTKHDDKHATVELIVHTGTFFAFRAQGDGAQAFAKFNPYPGSGTIARKCKNQWYLNTTGSTLQPVTYTFGVEDASGVTVGFASLPGAVSILEEDLSGKHCPATSYCCPDAKHCLTPTHTSCVKDASVCDKDQACCPITKICVDVGDPCTSPCADQGSYCCPDAKHCLTPTNPGVFCSSDSSCQSVQ